MLPNKTIKFLLLLAVAVAGALYWQHQSAIFADKGRLVVRQLEDGERSVVLSWHHDIEVPMVQRFREAFEEWRGKTGRFVIELSSRGGALYEGRKLVELIDDIRRTHRIDTLVGPDGICLSMCVPIFMTGERRMAAGSSKWMFHEPRFFNSVTDEETDVPDRERKALAERFFARYFSHPDISPQWRAALKREWQGKDVWRTGAELVREQSGIVTDSF